MNTFFIVNLFSLFLTAGNYEGAVEASNSAAAITSVLYPNDHTYVLHLIFYLTNPDTTMLIVHVSFLALFTFHSVDAI